MLSRLTKSKSASKWGGVGGRGGEFSGATLSVGMFVNFMFGLVGCHLQSHVRFELKGKVEGERKKERKSQLVCLWLADCIVLHFLACLSS